MSWNDNNGPWGSGENKSGNGKPNPENLWTQKNRKPESSPDGDFTPPDLEALIKKFNKWAEPFKPNGNSRFLILVLGALFAVWILSGVYQVSANEEGVVMRFGAFNRTEMPGLRYHIPYPVENVVLQVVTSQNEIPVGFRRSSRSNDNTITVPEESMMLTQDENVINVEFTVFWRVSDVSKFLFEVRAPENTIKMAAESVMREVIGQSKLQFALTDGRGQIADEARSRLQALMDEYNIGVVIPRINLQTVSVPDEVKAAFQDVVNARLDQERFQNQAAAHVNKVIPDAKGQAAQILQQAMAYRDQKIALAQGDADRFKEVLLAYNLSKDVTTKRLYLETMEEVLGKANKVVMDKSVGGGAIPFFPLRELTHSNNGDKQ